MKRHINLSCPRFTLSTVTRNAMLGPQARLQLCNCAAFAPFETNNSSQQLPGCRPSALAAAQADSLLCSSASMQQAAQPCVLLLKRSS
jgi:hypothetical protein